MRKKLTQSELAEKIGVTQPAVSHIYADKKGNTSFRRSVLNRIAQDYGIPLRQFAALTGKELINFLAVKLEKKQPRLESKP